METRFEEIQERDSLHFLLIPSQDSGYLLLLIVRLSPLLLGRKGNFFRNPQSKEENSLPVLGVLRERNIIALISNSNWKNRISLQILKNPILPISRIFYYESISINIKNRGRREGDDAIMDLKKKLSNKTRELLSGANGELFAIYDHFCLRLPIFLAGLHLYTYKIIFKVEEIYIFRLALLCET